MPSCRRARASRDARWRGSGGRAPAPRSPRRCDSTRSRRLLGLGAQRAHLRIRVAGDAMQPVDLFLQSVAALLVLGELRARIGELRLDAVALTLGVGDDVAQRAHFLLAADDAGMHVLVATDAQPVAPDPDAVARNDGFAAEQRAALVERFGQRVDGDDAGRAAQRSPPGPARAPAIGRRRPSARWRRPRRRTTRHRPAATRGGSRSHRSYRRDTASRYEPSTVSTARSQPGSTTSCWASRGRSASEFEPSHSGDLALRQAERRLLQGLQRHQAPLPVLQLLATAIIGGDELALALAQPLHFLGGLAQLIRRAARPRRESAPAPPAALRGARRPLRSSTATARLAAARAAQPAASADAPAARCARARPASSRWRRASRD